ncbi:MAG: SMC-Scp complex subunit ScpB [Thermoguttaceae bacterium]
MAGSTQPTPEMPHPQGISLDELTRAFAQAMGSAPTLPGEQDAQQPPARQVAPATQAAADRVQSPESRVQSPESRIQSPEEDPCPINPRSILEAMLFVGDSGNQAVSAARAAELMRGVEAGEIPSLVHELNHRYTAAGCPYYIASDRDGYRMTLRKPFHGVCSRFSGRPREAHLSQSAIDTLAIIAYQQPLTAEQVSKLRGKPSGHVLAQLVHRGLLRMERLANKRRTAQYFTSDRFLALFGLQTLADLPQSEELDRQ